MHKTLKALGNMLESGAADKAKVKTKITLKAPKKKVSK